MPTLADLLERVEKASGPDRGLDEALANAFGWDFQTKSEGGRVWTEWKRPEGFRLPLGTLADPPFFTASIDAALALVERVLPGANCLGVEKTPHGWDGYVSRNYVADGHWLHEGHDRASAPLALLAALLRALIANPHNPKVEE